MTPLEQSKEIIRKHCKQQPKPCYLMRDLEDPFSEIETELKDYELLKERTRLDSFECLMRLEEILPRGKELLIPVAKELKELEIIKENLEYGYVFIGYNKDNEPLFQFADTKLYEEIKKNMKS